MCSCGPRVKKIRKLVDHGQGHPWTGGGGGVLPVTSLVGTNLRMTVVQLCICSKYCLVQTEKMPSPPQNFHTHYKPPFWKRVGYSKHKHISEHIPSSWFYNITRMNLIPRSFCALRNPVSALRFTFLILKCFPTDHFLPGSGPVKRN